MKIADEKAMLDFANQLSKSVEKGSVIFLHGLLGAGKTTLTRGFLQGLGYEGKVKSPTYTLVEPYDVSGRQIYHFDFYRINDPEELHFIGVEDYFTPESICIVEWAEKGYPVLPLPDVNCYIEMRADGREIKLEACSEKGKKIIEKLPPSWRAT